MITLEQIEQLKEHGGMIKNDNSGAIGLVPSSRTVRLIENRKRSTNKDNLFVLWLGGGLSCTCTLPQFHDSCGGFWQSNSVVEEEKQ